MKYATFEPIEINYSPTLEDVNEYYSQNPNQDWEEVIKPYLSLPDLPQPEPKFNLEVEKPEKWTPKQVIQKTKVEIQPDSSSPTFSSNAIIQSIQNLPISNLNKDYLIKMAKAESGYNLLIENQIGAKGLYQFVPSTLAHLGLSEEDLQNPEKQHYAALKLNQQNKTVNSHIFNNLVGKRISKDLNGNWKRNSDGTLQFTDDGIEITENGLLAVHALLGAGGVRDWVNGTQKTWTGRNGNADQNGTNPEKYLKLFI